MTAPPRTILPADVEELLPVLEMLADGMTNARIGRRIGLSESAVKTRVRAWFEHLGARDRAHAVALGFQRGYLARGVLPDVHASTCALLQPRVCDCKEVQR